MMSKKFMKILCIVLAALMVLSVVAVVFSTFAVGGSAQTGENDLPKAVFIAIGAVAVVAVVVCLVLPKFKKKDKEK